MDTVDPIQPGSVRILLVEDHPGEAQMIRQMLDATGMERPVPELSTRTMDSPTSLRVGAGIGPTPNATLFEVIHVARLHEALALLATRQPIDMILLDLILPDSEGIATLRRIRSFSRETPIIVLTVVQDETLALKAVQEGAQDYLIKFHINGRALRRAILYSLQRHTLEDTSRRFAFMANTSRDFMYLLDRDFRFESVNDSFCLAHGKSRDQLIGMPAMALWGKTFFTEVLKPSLEECLTGHEITLEERYDFPSLGSRCLETVFCPYFTESGDVSHVVAVAHDVTDRRQIEEALAHAHLQLKRSNDELEARVQSRTLELSRMNKDLETMLYVISHDLKEPLRAIENFSRLVQETEAPRFSDKGHDFLDRVIRAADRLHHLLDDILFISRVRHLPLQPEDVDGESVVEEALTRLEDAVRRTGGSVQVVGPLPRLRVHKLWVVEAIYNLIDNALKFTANGRPPEITISGFGTPNGNGSPTGFVVKDRGPGIPTDQADRMFKLFQRGVPRNVHGTGAGLAIVRQIAERHGGGAWVRPRPEGGSEFVLNFAPTPLITHSAGEKASA